MSSLLFGNLTPQAYSAAELVAAITDALAHHRLFPLGQGIGKEWQFGKLLFTNKLPLLTLSQAAAAGKAPPPLPFSFLMVNLSSIIL